MSPLIRASCGSTEETRAQLGEGLRGVSARQAACEAGGTGGAAEPRRSSSAAATAVRAVPQGKTSAPLARWTSRQANEKSHRALGQCAGRLCTPVGGGRAPRSDAGAAATRSQEATPPQSTAGSLSARSRSSHRAPCQAGRLAGSAPPGTGVGRRGARSSDLLQATVIAFALRRLFRSFAARQRHPGNSAQPPVRPTPPIACAAAWGRRPNERGAGCGALSAWSRGTGNVFTQPTTDNRNVGGARTSLSLAADVRAKPEAVASPLQVTRQVQRVPRRLRRQLFPWRQPRQPGARLPTALPGCRPSCTRQQTQTRPRALPLPQTAVCGRG